MEVDFQFISYGLALVVIIVVAISFYLNSVNVDEAWDIAAKILRLSHQSGHNRMMTGVIDGYYIKVNTYTNKPLFDNIRKDYTAYQIKYPSLGLGLGIIRKDAAGSFSGHSRKTVVEVGDPKFDEEFLIRATRPDLVRSLISPELRRMIQTLFSEYSGDVSIDDEYIKCNELDFQDDSQLIVKKVKMLISIADLLTQYSSTPETETEMPGAPDPNYEVKAEQDAYFFNADHAEQPGAGLFTAEESPADQVYAVETAAEESPANQMDAGESGAEESPANRMDTGETAAEESLSDQVDAVETGAEESPANQVYAGETGAEESAGPEAESPGFSTLEGLCITLFASGKSGLEISNIFEERFKGQFISGSGILKKVEDYSFDFVFGRDPGTRGIVEIHPEDSDSAARGSVQAIVQFPSAESESLRNQVGQTVDFSGYLLRLDAFMRNLYVGSNSPNS